jgi:hypothetical protein
MINLVDLFLNHFLTLLLFDTNVVVGVVFSVTFDVDEWNDGVDTSIVHRFFFELFVQSKLEGASFDQSLGPEKKNPFLTEKNCEYLGSCY